MALPAKICAALHGRSIVGSKCDSKKSSSSNLSVLSGMPSGVERDHGTGPRGNGNVNSRSTLCTIERRAS